MIHDTNLSTFQRFTALFSAALLLSACAGSKDQYPSFAIPTGKAEAGRVAASFPTVAVPKSRTADIGDEALPAELDARLAAINTRAMNAVNAFAADAPATRALVEGAVLSEVESDSWSNAQLGISSLASYHGTAQLALADLDQLAATAAIASSSPEDAAMIAELQTSLSQTLEEQARLLASMSARLDR